ncbi:MAG: non-ribosomal peptide synthetase [Oscillospiraceae bacterium]|nr:non-ribosomal peptide synthetase [Oscillospiraceae bacterium]
MKLLIECLKESFSKYADKTAYIDRSGSRMTTYGQLDELSGKIAAGIIEQGCKKGDIIPVLMPRCTEYIAAEIGIMKAGCVFAPLITDYPQDRIEYIKKECKSSFVVDKAFVDKCADKTPCDRISKLSHSDPAVVIYTSGSTGNPKGIIHTHKSLYHSIIRQLELEDTKDTDVCLSTITHSFSVSLPENYVPLTAGATIVMLNDEERKDVRFLENAIAQYGITNTYISPGMLKVYRNKSKTLKTVKTVGERLCNQYSQDYNIINIYGASETLLALAFHVDKSYENTPIGKPVKGISVYILDDSGKPVKNGEEGELCVAGAISEGYLNLPEQTAKAYEPNPYSTCDDDKILFHTNDMVKQLEDGNIVYVNRKDWMVKINGQRVEAGEIEICSQNVNGVDRAVVKAFVNDYGQNYLVEYFKGDGVTAEKIKEHLHTVLPDYMIPLFFVKVDEFPLNANGKIDRLALKEPDASMFKTDYVPPESETEKLLCEKFEEVLNCGKVGIKDSFFDLGGDSIKVIKLQSICNISKLSTKIIFDGKTPENIAVLLENTADEEIYDILSDYPLTQTQNGIFVECAANPGTTIYNIPCLYKLGKNVDLNKLKSAVESTINAHPYIKTKLFLNENGDIRAKRNDKEKPIVNSLFQALIKSLSFHLLTLQPQQLCALPEQTVSLLFIMPATDTELKWETL